MRVGLLGMGTVGVEVARGLMEKAPLLSERAGAAIELAVVAVRHPQQPRAVDLRGVPIIADASAVVGDPSLDIIVELIGGESPAGDLIAIALRAGRAVVTANKAVIARRGPELTELARGRAPLRYEAAVGGGMPIIALLREGLRGERVHSLDSVINGTTNFIIDRMAADGITLDTAVSEAQSLGFAEADPSADLDGEDAAAKLSIMAWLAFGTHVDPGAIDTTGIREIDPADIGHARDLGYAVRLVARGRRTSTSVSLGVGPALVPLSHPLASVAGAGNRVVLEGDLVGAVVLSAAGAGGRATASAILSDLVTVARMREAGVADDPPPVGPLPVLEAGDAETGAYLRLETAAAPEAAGTVALMLQDRGVAVDGIAELPAGDERGCQLICLTAPAPRGILRGALETLDTLPIVRRLAACLDRLTE
ncbi:MAG: homoserine dehydrogenase [Candidatus Dormibacteria bacterium]